MKLMIASDIHGSSYYCEKLISAFKLENADRLFLLGDILYHGPRNELPKDYAPKRVISMLNQIKDKIFCVRGNCDTEVDQMVLDFPILADYAVIAADKKMIYATHGHIFNNSNLPNLQQGDVLLHGHTHIPACQVFDSHIYINPGSVSIPKEGTPNSYIIFEDDEFLWKDLDGNIYKQYAI